MHLPTQTKESHIIGRLETNAHRHAASLHGGHRNKFLPHLLAGPIAERRAWQRLERLLTDVRYFLVNMSLLDTRYHVVEAL
jgi:hypothetical protein